MCELEKIVGGADDGPLGAHLVDAAHQELAESACLLDLPEHRLGELLAQSVGAGVPAGLDFCAHGLDRVGDPAGCVEGGAAGTSTLPATASPARPVAT